MKVAVIGAGGAGLSAARALKQAGLEVLVFEAEPRAGGKIGTHVEDGFRCEEGPNSFAAASPTALRLARELRLDVIEAQRPRTRYVARGGKLKAAPSPGLLSPAGWGRLLLEPVLAKPSGGGEESLAAFFVRHFGAEAGALGARLMAAGVYAGDPERLSVKEAFGKIAALEGGGGSVILGAFRRKREPKDAAAPGSLWSLSGGLGTLTDALSAELKGELRLSTPVEAVGPSGKGYRLRLSGSGAGEVDVDGLVSALPPRAAAALLGPLSPGLSKLTEIRSAPIAVVHLGYRANDFTRPPRGFGVLDGNGSGDGSLGVLGVLFPSSLFPGRAPEGGVLLTALLGGVLQPQVVDFDDETLIGICHKAYATLFGASGLPSFRRVVRWREAVPQPELGHAKRVAEAQEAAALLPLLELAGAAFGGPSVEQVLSGGEGAAEKLRARLARREA